MTNIYDEPVRNIGTEFEEFKHSSVYVEPVLHSKHTNVSRMSNMYVRASCKVNKNIITKGTYWPQTS